MRVFVTSLPIDRDAEIQPHDWRTARAIVDARAPRTIVAARVLDGLSIVRGTTAQVAGREYPTAMIIVQAGSAPPRTVAAVVSTVQARHAGAPIVLGSDYVSTGTVSRRKGRSRFGS